MTSAIQLELFPDFYSVNQNLAKYKDSSDKVRRGVFAKVGELEKTHILPMKEILERHEKHIVELNDMVEELTRVNDQMKETLERHEKHIEDLLGMIEKLMSMVNVAENERSL